MKIDMYGFQQIMTLPGVNQHYQKRVLEKSDLFQRFSGKN